MNLTESPKRIELLLLDIQRRCAEQYQPVTLHDEAHFLKKNGVIFGVSKFPGENAVVVEYADNILCAEKLQLEDGDRFYLGDMTDQEIIEAVLREIEQAESEQGV